MKKTLLVLSLLLPLGACSRTEQGLRLAASVAPRLVPRLPAIPCRELLSVVQSVRSPAL